MGYLGTSHDPGPVLIAARHAAIAAQDAAVADFLAKPSPTATDSAVLLRATIAMAPSKSATAAGALVG